jgi:hypothetical protein
MWIERMALDCLMGVPVPKSHFGAPWVAPEKQDRAQTKRPPGATPEGLGTNEFVGESVTVPEHTPI